MVRWYRYTFFSPCLLDIFFLLPAPKIWKANVLYQKISVSLSKIKKCWLSNRMTFADISSLSKVLEVFNENYRIPVLLKLMQKLLKEGTVLQCHNNKCQFYFSTTFCGSTSSTSNRVLKIGSSLLIDKGNRYEAQNKQSNVSIQRQFRLYHKNRLTLSVYFYVSFNWYSANIYWKSEPSRNPFVGSSPQRLIWHHRWTY